MHVAAKTTNRHTHTRDNHSNDNNNKRVFRAAVNAYDVSLFIFRGLDARGGKNYEQAHTYTQTRDNRSNGNNNYYKLFEALKLIRMYLCKIAHALCVSKHVTESIRNIAHGLDIN